MGEMIFSFTISFGLLIIAMTAHEFSHGFVAYKLGDTTAKYSGRLTLNPLAHIDPVWTLLVPFSLFIATKGQFVFGAAKPVPINFWALKNPKRDILLIGFAGPMANFILAFLLSICLRFFPLPQIIIGLITQLILINVVLGVFNLIPLPPLDGSRILSGILPDSLALRYAQIEPYGFIILFLLLWAGAIDYIIWPIVGFILKLLIIPGSI